MELGQQHRPRNLLPVPTPTQTTAKADCLFQREKAKRAEQWGGKRPPASTGAVSMETYVEGSSESRPGKLRAPDEHMGTA